MTKKLLAVLCIVALLVSMLVSCGKEQQITGVLQSFDGKTVVMKTEDGSILTFDVSKATLNTTNGMLAGDSLVVNYTGKIKNNDASSAKVVSLVDKAGKASLSEHSIHGTLTHAGLNSVSIDTADGQSYLFATAGAEMDIRDGLVEGNEIYITFVGELSDGDASNVKVVRIVDNTDNPDAVETPAVEFTVTDQNDTIYALTNVIVRALPDVTAKRIGGLDFAKSAHRTGTTSNGWCRIDFNGTVGYVYAEYISTSRPDSDAPLIVTEESYHTISGYVADATMNTLALNVNNAIYIFSTQNAARYYTNGLLVGNYVTLQYTGVIHSTDATNVTVLAIIDTSANTPAPQPQPQPQPAPAPTPTPASSSQSVVATDPPIGTGATVNSTPAPAPAPEPQPQDDPPIGTGATVNSTPAPVPAPEPQPQDDPPIGTGATVNSTSAPAPAPEPQPQDDPPIGTGATVDSTPAPAPAPEPAPVESQPVVDADPAIGDGAVLVDPQPDSPPAIGSGVSTTPTTSTMYGTVQGTTQNTVTILTEDGATLTYEITGDTAVTGTLDEGAHVSITIGAFDSQSNISIASAITVSPDATAHIIIRR